MLFRSLGAPAGKSLCRQPSISLLEPSLLWKFLVMHPYLSVRRRSSPPLQVSTPKEYLH